MAYHSGCRPEHTPAFFEEELVSEIVVRRGLVAARPVCVVGLKKDQEAVRAAVAAFA